MNLTRVIPHEFVGPDDQEGAVEVVVNVIKVMTKVVRTPMFLAVFVILYLILSVENIIFENVLPEFSYLFSELGVDLTP